MHFSSIAKPSSKEKHLIFLDGISSHKTLVAVEYARELRTELLTLPLHCTHKMQPQAKAFLDLRNLLTTYRGW